MINKTTIISRFEKSFGKPFLSTKGPMLIGSINQSVGLTAKPIDNIKLWYAKFYQENNRYPNKSLDINSIDTLQYEVGEELLFWEQKDLLSCYHIFDNKPFKKIKLRYWPNEIMPLAIFRDTYAVCIAPHIVDKEAKTKFEELKSQHKKRLHFEDHQLEWIRSLPDTTFWIVRDITIKSDEYVKCKLCNTEMLKLDYIKYSLKVHKWCRCSCFTYDDFCRCQWYRNFKANQKMARMLHSQKRFGGRQLT